MANGFLSREFSPEVRSGYNNTSSAIPKGRILVHGSTTDYVALAATDTAPYYGVSGEEIPAYSWGRVVVKGTALVQVASSITPGVRLTSDASGKAVAAATGDAVIGIGKEAGANDALIEVELAGPGGQLTATV
jgi:hypothetical protein